MTMIAKIHVTLKNGILDPQGKTVKQALKTIGIKNIAEVRLTKMITLRFEDISREEALASAEEACEKLLANPVIEEYSIKFADPLEMAQFSQ